MKFPETKIVYSDYWDRVKSAISDDECRIFFDTNILSFLFKINSLARDEFFAWVNSHNDKIKIPRYCISEYSKRYIKNSLKDYHSLEKDIREISNRLRGADGYVHLRIDDELVSKNGKYIDRDDFLDKYKKAKNVINDLATIAKEESEYYYNIAQEIKENLENKIITTDLFSAISKSHEEHASRYHCSIPPGYEDQNKKEGNRYGDLVIWNEILTFSKSADVKKAIFVTRDWKRDFVYAPLKVENEYGAYVNNSNGKMLKIADPRLISEFKEYTGSEEFYVINLINLIELLSKEKPSSYANIARAIQIEISIDSDEGLVADSDEQSSNCEAFNDEQESGAEDSVEQVERKPEDGIDEFSYSEQAIKDSSYTITDGDALDAIIDDLKTINWHTQNPAISRIRNLIVHSLGGEFSKDQWFVLGRNIYQAACGNAFKAIEFLESLHIKLGLSLDDVPLHIFNGMLFEVYFDCDGNFRGDQLKDEQLSQLAKLQKYERYSKSFEFIRDVLGSNVDLVVFIPSFQSEPVKLRLNFVTEDPSKISSITTESGMELLVEEEFFCDFFSDKAYSVASIINKIQNHYHIPKGQLVLDNDLEGLPQEFTFVDNYHLR